MMRTTKTAAKTKKLGTIKKLKATTSTKRPSAKSTSSKSAATGKVAAKQKAAGKKLTTKPKRINRDIEKAYPKAEFIAKIRRLADALEQNKRFSIQVANHRVHIPADAVINIEHEASGDSEELEFQLVWKR